MVEALASASPNVLINHRRASGVTGRRRLARYRARRWPAITKRLWASEDIPDGPTTIQGRDIDEVYERVMEVARAEADGNTLIVHLDLPSLDTVMLPLPNNYPMAEPLESGARQEWLRELVGWWQLGRSKLEQRMPFVHGSRLRRYGGKIDQIERIKKLLKQKASTRALAVLVDPFRDFTANGSGEEFASCSLVEFSAGFSETVGIQWK
ncbi:hypothetical protein [Mesorhizobium caraganae]|uniref:hypothetical protein n=1 Tax=Mesorhizobium caraganae TaxID=483206 RepID=UPI0033389DAC